MAEKAIHILDKDNLPKFKEAALARAKTFDVQSILPMYEDFYNETVEKFKISLEGKQRVKQ